MLCHRNWPFPHTIELYLAHLEIKVHAMPPFSMTQSCGYSASATTPDSAPIGNFKPKRITQFSFPQDSLSRGNCKYGELGYDVAVVLDLACTGGREFRKGRGGWFDRRCYRYTRSSLSPYNLVKSLMGLMLMRWTLRRIVLLDPCQPCSEPKGKLESGEWIEAWKNILARSSVDA